MTGLMTQTTSGYKEMTLMADICEKKICLFDLILYVPYVKRRQRQSETGCDNRESMPICYGKNGCDNREICQSVMVKLGVTTKKACQSVMVKLVVTTEMLWYKIRQTTSDNGETYGCIQ